jgi:predicted RNase H-like HicB family nuclease
MNKEKKLQKLLKRRYLIKIVPISKSNGGGYYACIPELGENAFLGDGNTIEEALKDLETIKKDLFIDFINQNMKIPLPKRYK